MLSFKLLSLAILIFSLNNVQAKHSLEKILSLCDDDSCDVPIQEEVSKYQGTEYNQKLYHLVTGGIPQIMWDFLRSDLMTESSKNGLKSRSGKSGLKLSNGCSSSLRSVLVAADQGKKWAFQLIAATGKPPETLFETTLTSLGDYDSCLVVESNQNSPENNQNFAGKYCLMDMFPMKFSNKSADEFSLEKITIFKYFPFKNGICLPSSCSDDEIKHILTESLRGYPLIVKGDMHCDTAESISWLNRVRNLNTHQIISLLFLVSVVSITSAATYYHVIALYIFGDTSCEKNELLMALSCWENMKKLCTQSPDKDSRFMVIDSLKLFTVFVGTVSHFMVALEIPNGYLLLDRHTNMNLIFSRAISQTFMNENGVTIFAFLGGFLIFVTLAPLLEAGKASYIMMIVFRYIHFVPSILCMMAIEFTWTWLFSGPFYTKVANYVLDKCTNNWWRNLFFIQNQYNSLDTCLGHSFSLATDYQLFLLGLFAIFLMSKSTKLGLTFCAVSSIASFTIVAKRAIEYETTGTIYTPFPTPIKIVEYLQFIYMSTEIYIPSYFLGFYCGYLYENGFKFKVETIWDHALYLNVSFVMQNMVSVINGSSNQFGLIPKSMVWLQIIANRVFFTSSIALVFMYFMSIDSIYGIALPRIESSLTKKRREEESRIRNEQSAKMDSTECTKENLSSTECGKKLETIPVENNEKNESKDGNNNVVKSVQPVQYSLFAALCRLSYSIFMANYAQVKYEFFTSRSLITLDWHPLAKRLAGSMFFCLVWSFTFYCFFVAPFDQINKRFIFKRAISKQEKEKAN